MAHYVVCYFVMICTAIILVHCLCIEQTLHIWLEICRLDEAQWLLEAIWWVAPVQCIHLLFVKRAHVGQRGPLIYCVRCL